MFLEKQLTGQFDSLVEYAEDINRRNGGSGTAVVVIHKGRIVTESYRGTFSHEPAAKAIRADSQFNVASARKSYIGFAVAWAVHQGKVRSIDDPVREYLPELDRELLAGTTIRHLLTHTHGLHEDAQGNLYREFAPGTDWAYRGVNIVMLTDIVRRTTGKTVAQILDESVFQPLGFTETGWRKESTEQLVPVILDAKHETEMILSPNADGDGDRRNLYVSARELAYWGYLHLTKGNIGGRQIVPAEVIEMATRVQSPELSDQNLPRNGFLWHAKSRPAEQSEIGADVPNGSYQILGVTGPLVLVIPEHGLVVARMYNKRYNYSGDKGENYLYYLREFGDRVMECLEPCGSDQTE